MRLTHIRLAGFKSFVEPTSFAVPSNLVGVVGPNGCGKSNIIDAVRWVLGESKASELRGESMQDVIFNGSTNRKPASRASVELVFDNAEGRAGGSWNQYSELSVKRVLTRDGASTYYINQQAVRRRDVQDIFLGTGLGPRAYAIIGQGMIARLIEARPEELRIFLEEAAGVSKYKERRRETGNRLSDTRDNLTRVEDIRRELGGQIERLEQQAVVARQYKEFETEKSAKQQMLWFTRLVDAQDQKNACSARLERAKADLEHIQSKSVHTQTELLLMREKQMDAQQQLDTDQSAWIEANRNVSKLEADLRVMAESRSRLSARVRELDGELKLWAEREAAASENLAAAREESADHAFLLEEAVVSLEDAEAALEPVEVALSSARQNIEAKRAKVIEVQRDLSLASSQQESATRSLSNIQLKLERLTQERGQVNAPSDADIQKVTSEYETLNTEVDGHRQTLSAREAAVLQLQQEFEESQRLFTQERDHHANVQAQLQALTELNAQLADSAELKPWIQRSGLAQTPRILNRLKVERGWEKAVESALREHLDSFEASNLESVAGFASAPPPSRIAFIETQGASSAHRSPGPDELASVISSSDVALKRVIDQLLAGILMADTLQSALQRRKSLLPGQRIYTPQGHCVASAGLSFYAAEGEQSGRLERNQQIEALSTELKALELLRGESMAKRDRLQLKLSEQRASLQSDRQTLDRLIKQAHEAQLALLKLQEAQGRANSRREQIELDIAVLKSEQEEQQAVLLETEEVFAELDEKLALASEELESAKTNAMRLEQQLRDKQAQIQQAQRKKQDVEFAIRNQESRLREFEREIRYAQEQAHQLEMRRSQAQAELSSLSEDEGQALLQDALQARVIAEDQVAAARERLEQIMSEVSRMELQEKESERQAQPLRDSIQDLALKVQAADLTLDQFDQLLTEVQADRQALAAELSNMDIPPKASVLQADVTRLGNAMQALGAVNLAALDELGAASDRKSFLDAQAQDLQDAMSTLEDAIHKIDLETRELLSETFNLVNAHFSRLFPLLFGGGEARLVMTGDEILDAGVQVFAQPPGKKNGTIHLLSGGEKALTATALVFAIFELNPAPFCLLDEVDAPLDDANTERFSKLVRQMAEQTQFLFISHNKIAMEMAEQLIGVTMQEKGVSRIVAVDLASAEKMAMETV